MLIEKFIKLAKQSEATARSKRQADRLQSSVIEVVKQDLPTVEKELANIGETELAGRVESELDRLNEFINKVGQLEDEDMQYRNYKHAAGIVTTLVRELLDAQKERGLDPINPLEKAAGHLGFYDNLGIKAS